jgi:hypothetical protein
MMSDPIQAQVPADVDAPDRVLYGMSARQVAILAGTGVVLWVAYRALFGLVAPLVLLIAAVPVAAVAVGLALGRRDGISMDRWVGAALAQARSARRLVPIGQGLPAAPGWAPHAGTQRSVRAQARARASRVEGSPPVVAPLRLPATAIDENGVVDLDGPGRVALTAVSTINFDLRTVQEQAALVDAAGRWLNSLSTPVQIVVSTRRVDMHAYADAVEDQIDELSHPALAEAAAGYAEFLRALGEDRDPLQRQVSIAHRVGAHAEAGVARRHAEHSARVLSGLGAATRVLDGGLVTDVLAAACDPWRHAGTGRAVPDAVISAVRDEAER